MDHHLVYTQISCFVLDPLMDQPSLYTTMIHRALEFQPVYEILLFKIAAGTTMIKYVLHYVLYLHQTHRFLTTLRRFYTSKFSHKNYYNIIHIIIVMYYSLVSFKYWCIEKRRWWSSAKTCSSQQRNVLFRIIVLNLLVL